MNRPLFDMRAHETEGAGSPRRFERQEHCENRCIVNRRGAWLFVDSRRTHTAARDRRREIVFRLAILTARVRHPLFVDLLAQVILEPDLFDSVLLRFEPVDMLLFAFDDLFQFMARREIADVGAMSDGFPQQGDIIYF